jgi:hypothetical protein
MLPTVSCLVCKGCDEGPGTTQAVQTGGTASRHLHDTSCTGTTVSRIKNKYEQTPSSNSEQALANRIIEPGGERTRRAKGAHEQEESEQQEPREHTSMRANPKASNWRDQGLDPDVSPIKTPGSTKHTFR